MKKIAMLLLISMTTLLASACSAGSESGSSFTDQIYNHYPQLKSQKMTTGQVKRVVDGDTFTLETGEKVRLIGVNTPETVKPDSPVEQYGKEASAFTKDELTGKKVYLFSDAGDSDKYGRLLRYVFIDGQTVMFNELLIREGYANVMTIQPNAMFADAFVKLEREARQQNKGLWGAEKKPGQTSGSSSGESAPGKPASAASCKNPAIKGNINSKNEKIYHMPGGASYDQTQAEEMFCTEKEAQSAGFRKAGK
ncbi:thermonuclease family protein [Paenibacillus lutrae]|uniref:Nuclease n=1 Tax=Paenibacillus lutrae TaxID=2078573 RepID=A0A7X3FGL5_9BACL|nr:thermonuclease family protein [Paenibacillus lutrae]MVO99252.1 nuclease [Paenibacillus lutrae]